MRINDRARLISLHIAEGWRQVRQTAAVLTPAFVQRGGFRINRVIVAPTDLRAVDAFVADEILNGRFPLAGRILDADGQSPFELELPSLQFARRLHGFGWLRHMRADKSVIACNHARWITDQWIGLHGGRAGVAWESDVVSRRIISWLSIRRSCCRTADAGFYRRFTTSLSQQVRYLQRRVDSLPEGLPRLKARIAIAMARSRRKRVRPPCAAPGVFSTASSNGKSCRMAATSRAIRRLCRSALRSSAAAPELHQPWSRGAIQADPGDRPDLPGRPLLPSHQWRYRSVQRREFGAGDRSHERVAL